jgi:hypothetical protein
MGILCKKETVVYEGDIGTYSASAFMKGKLGPAGARHLSPGHPALRLCVTLK